MDYKEKVQKDFKLNDLEVNIAEFIFNGLSKNPNYFVSSQLVSRVFKIDRHKTDRILKKLVENCGLFIRAKHKRYYHYDISINLIIYLQEKRQESEEIRYLIKKVYGKRV